MIQRSTWTKDLDQKTRYELKHLKIDEITLKNTKKDLYADMTIMRMATCQPGKMLNLILKL